MLADEEDETVNRIRKLEAEIEILTDALLKYGSHNSGCLALLDDEYDNCCTCGFSDALNLDGERSK